MRFDTIIIGGGLSGLVGGIALSRRGERVAIFSSGKSALHFSSGSLELCHDGVEEISSLAESNPNHPYSKIGKESIEGYTEIVKDIFARAGVALVGDGVRNHQRMTPLGALKPAWLTMEEYATFEGEEEIAGRRIALGNIEGYMDFYPEFVASSLRRYGAECTTFEMRVPELDGFRESATELRSVNISRILTGENLAGVAAELRTHLKGDEDLVLLPAVFGFDDPKAYERLSREAGCKVRLLPTVSVSVPGMRAQRLLTEEFVRLGGLFVGGDTVVSAAIEEGRVRSVRTANHGDQDFEADNFIFATGSFFSRGVIATPTEVYEPVAGLDVAFEASRDDWYAPHILESQPFQRFGIVTDESLHPMIEGRVVENAWAVGSLLAGADSVGEGSGAGIAVMTALRAAEQVAQRDKESVEQ